MCVVRELRQFWREIRRMSEVHLPKKMRKFRSLKNLTIWYKLLKIIINIISVIQNSHHEYFSTFQLPN
jgi:hypothetical protein